MCNKKQTISHWHLITANKNDIPSGHLIRKVCGRTRQISCRHLTTAREQEISKANLVRKFSSQKHVISWRNLTMAPKARHLQQEISLRMTLLLSIFQHPPRSRTHSHACLYIPSSPTTWTPDRTLEPLEHEFTSRPVSRSQKYVSTY